MGILTGKSGSNEQQSDPVLVVMRKLQDFIKGLIGFFILTDEEQLQAGIFHGRVGRDE